jgi:hypothetical protein
MNSFLIFEICIWAIVKTTAPSYRDCQTHTAVAITLNENADSLPKAGVTLNQLVQDCK